MTINEYMSHEHRRCDEEFVDAENAISTQESNSIELFEKFVNSTKRHFRMEEEVMFYQYNKIAGGMNPSVVMVSEHNQMRGIMDTITASLKSHDFDKALGLCENMLFIMQQHNMKEEQMMYTLADGALNATDIIEKMLEVSTY